MENTESSAGDKPGNTRENNGEVVEREVASWTGVTTGDTTRGGLQFSYGRVELGHLHGDRFADLPFTKKTRNELISDGRVSVHPPLPNSGWGRRSMETVTDVEDVIRLFRMNYERARESAERVGSQHTNGGLDPEA